MAIFACAHPIEKIRKKQSSRKSAAQESPSGSCYSVTSFLLWQKFWRSALFQTNAVYGGTYPTELAASSGTHLLAAARRSPTHRGLFPNGFWRRMVVDQKRVNFSRKSTDTYCASAEQPRKYTNSKISLRKSHWCLYFRRMYNNKRW